MSTYVLYGNNQSALILKSTWPSYGGRNILQRLL